MNLDVVLAILLILMAIGVIAMAATLFSLSLSQPASWNISRRWLTSSIALGIIAVIGICIIVWLQMHGTDDRRGTTFDDARLDALEKRVLMLETGAKGNGDHEPTIVGVETFERIADILEGLRIQISNDRTRETTLLTTETSQSFLDRYAIPVVVISVAALVLIYLLLTGAKTDPWIKWAKRTSAWGAALITVATGLVAVIGKSMDLVDRADRTIAVLPLPEYEAARAYVLRLENEVAVKVTPEAESPMTFVIPFDEAICDGADPRTWTGTNPTQFDSFLETLATDLLSCGTPERSIRIEIRGFASSSPYKKDPADCDGAGSSNEANLRIANARRDNVRSVMQRKLEQVCGFDCALKIVDHSWGPTDAPDSFELMEAARRFNDRWLNQTYSKQRGMMNRRAEIRILDAGDCDLKRESFLTLPAEPSTQSKSAAESKTP